MSIKCIYLYGNGVPLRDLNNSLKVSDVSDKPHDLSRVFSGAIYELLNIYFQRYIEPTQYTLAESLRFATMRLQGVLLNACYVLRDQQPTFFGIMHAMYHFEPKKDLKQHIFNVFQAREMCGQNDKCLLNLDSMMASLIGGEATPCKRSSTYPASACGTLWQSGKAKLMAVAESKHLQEKVQRELDQHDVRQTKDGSHVVTINYTNASFGGGN
jgi:hypothetical protein